MFGGTLQAQVLDVEEIDCSQEILWRVACERARGPQLFLLLLGEHFAVSGHTPILFLIR